MTDERPVPKGGRYFMNAVTFAPILKVPKIICGPGDAKVSYRRDEHVEAVKLAQAVRIFSFGAAK